MLNLYLVKDHTGPFLLRHRNGEEIWRYEQDRRGPFLIHKNIRKGGRICAKFIFSSGPIWSFFVATSQGGEKNMEIRAGTETVFFFC